MGSGRAAEVRRLLLLDAGRLRGGGSWLLLDLLDLLLLLLLLLRLVKRGRSRGTWRLLLLLLLLLRLSRGRRG